jgi:hypothetical protein
LAPGDRDVLKVLLSAYRDLVSTEHSYRESGRTLGHERLPLDQSGRAAELECLAVDEVAFGVEVVVQAGVDEGEFLKRLHLPEWQVRILRPIVQPTPHFAAFQIAQLSHRCRVPSISSVTSFPETPCATSDLPPWRSGMLRPLLQHEISDQGDLADPERLPDNPRMTALLNQAVNAIAIPNDRRNTIATIGTILVKAEDSPVRIPGGMYLASNAMLESRKPQLRSCLIAMGQAIDWIRTHKAEATAICVEAVQTTAKDCSAAIDINFDLARSDPYHWSVSHAMNRDGMNAALVVKGPGTRAEGTDA